MSETTAPLTLNEAQALLKAPPSPYSVTRIALGDAEFTAFEHAPKNLRAMYALAARHDARTMLVFEDERYTFADVQRRAANLAHRLLCDHGVARGDRVALAMRNYPEWCMAYMAITALGAVVVPLNAWWTGAELEHGLRDSGSRLLICDRERLDRVRALLPALGLRALVARSSAALPSFAEDVAPLLEGDRPWPSVEVAPDDAVSLFYTSGSTGFPKGVLTTHRAVINAVMTWEFLFLSRMLAELPAAAVERVRAWLQLGPGALGTAPIELPQASTLLTLPLFHVTGCNVQFLPQFRGGRKLVMMRRWDPERALELIEREKITDFTGVPTMSWELVHSPEFAKRDTSTLRSLSAAGAARPPAHVSRLKQKSAQALPSTGYGMTETSGLGTAIGGDDYLARPASVGRPLQPLVEMCVVDPNGRELARGEEGELCIKSVTNMREYWNHPQATAQTLHEGWVRTGDLGAIDAENFVFITGRAKDIVIRGGENISCAEVERALYEHPGVFEAAAYGVPDERLGEALAVTIMQRAGAEPLSAEAVQAHVAARLSRFKVPAHVFLQADALPRVASGKIDKRALQRESTARLGAAKTS
jgi:long-chain acyl-CoA synthetase